MKKLFLFLLLLISCAVFSSEKARGQFIGELGEKWDFPSDHLPIGITIEGIHIASWNILNSEYCVWIKNNQQGLNNSLLTKLDFVVDSSGLTKRDIKILDAILEMLKSPSHPRSLIALQECSQPFIEALKKELPAAYKMSLSSDRPIEDQNLFIYDSSLLKLVKKEVKEKIFSFKAYPNAPPRTITHLYFETNRGSHKKWEVMTMRLPAIPGNPAPLELARYFAQNLSADTLTLALGDMNFNEVIMHSALKTEIASHWEWNLIFPYCTNIGLDQRSKAIDHFLIAALQLPEIKENQAEEVLPGLDRIRDLIDEL